MTTAPFRLPPSFREKIWGSTELEPWFRNSEAKIGEVWFTSGCADLPILTKFLFTSEKLSVQVHPDDDYAHAHEGGPGKTEMWHVLRAGRGAAIAAGFRETITRERLREAAVSGEVERLLNWIPVRPGDTIFAPARTVHAIGAGLALCEIQQHSDKTYRLYDYGRPRELHLENAVAVASLDTHPGIAQRSAAGPGRWMLAECRYFAVELLEFGAAAEVEPAPGPHIVVVIQGTGRIAGRAFGPGEVWLVPAASGPLAIEPDADARMLRTWAPES